MEQTESIGLDGMGWFELIGLCGTDRIGQNRLDWMGWVGLIRIELDIMLAWEAWIGLDGMDWF